MSFLAILRRSDYYVNDYLFHFLVEFARGIGSGFRGNCHIRRTLKRTQQPKMDKNAGIMGVSRGIFNSRFTLTNFPRKGDFAHLKKNYFDL